MEKTLTFEEIQVLIERVLESGSEISLQNTRNKGNLAYYSLYIKVTSCRPIVNGIQFHLKGGYINLEFKEDITMPNGFLEEKTYDLAFTYDNDRPKGYRLDLGEAQIFFYGDKVKEILENIKEETKDYNKKKILEQEARAAIADNDQFHSKEFWDSIDNMMEK